MTQEEINKKAFKAYPEDCAWVKVDDENSTNYTEIDSDGQAWLKVDTNKPYREGYIKALTEINELPKIPIWVGRDQDNTLRGFTEIPGRARGLATLEGLWYTDSDNFIVLPFDLLPDLKWEDDPIEVELLIRKV